MLEFVQVFLRRLASLFRRRGLEDDLDEELRSHLEMAVELHVRKGMALRRPAARRVAASAALSKLRKLIATREDCP